MSEIEKLYKKAGAYYVTYVVDTFPPVEYPQIKFTSEKQLKLAKWLINKGQFGEGISSMINNIWKDLTNEEQLQIRSILNEV